LANCEEGFETILDTSVRNRKMSSRKSRSASTVFTKYSSSGDPQESTEDKLAQFRYFESIKSKCEEIVPELHRAKKELEAAMEGGRATDRNIVQDTARLRAALRVAQLCEWCPEADMGMKDEAAALLRRRVLTDALTDTSNPKFLADVAEIAIDGGETRLHAIMAALSRHGEALAKLRIEGVEPLLRRALGLADGDSQAATLAVGIVALPLLKLQQFGQAMSQQSGERAVGIGGDVVAFCMAADKPNAWDGFWKIFYKGDGETKKPDWMIPKALADWRPFCAEVQEQLLGIRADLERWQILEFAGRHLRVAVRLAQDWRAAKHRAGVIDHGLDASVQIIRPFNGDAFHSIPFSSIS
jgi:hypothetical protein